MHNKYWQCQYQPQSYYCCNCFLYQYFTSSYIIFFVTDESQHLHFSQYLEKVHIPIWLLVSGCAVFFVPGVYFIYDKYCKDEHGGPMIKSMANCIVISYLLCGLAWSVVGFLWIFGASQHLTCGADSATYQFAFAALIILNIIMDAWICFKICVVLYWAFLSDD